MRLIGMLDSPYVRRVAISLRTMGIAFAHQPVSVFRDFDAFASINPVVKAPTLVLDDDTVLLDSSLILAWLDRICAPDRRLNPASDEPFLVSQYVLGLALAACEKSVQIVYETNLRPAEKQHQPWLDRVEHQLLAAYDALDRAYCRTEAWLLENRPMLADITAAVAWRFTQSLLPDRVPRDRCPALRSLSMRAEATSDFLACPSA